jgi:diaminohydroxyphosphoribosylaminopyrimidine deaminase/5-amino-6-(5-phosphoribosylamino)uracil reductase
MSDLKDISYLQMAYALAEKAKGWTSPNPYVGAVIVHKDTIVGYGYHRQSGYPHAEILALQRAGRLSRQSTLYTTLEPCVHWGKTPPCVDALVQAGLKRVVISALDPNPLVYKKGLKKIRGAGLRVSVGLLEEKNRSLNEAYLKYITKKIPLVTVKAAASLDGKIATRKHESRWISSPETREYIHLLRGEYDALMVGINTIINDDPLLTVRHSNWNGKRLTRLILDSSLRFPLKARILSTLPQGRILVFTSEKSSPRKADVLRKKGAEIIPLPLSSNGLRLKDVLSWLGKHEISSVLVEGGGKLITAMIEGRLVDKVFLTISPRLIGGKNAPSLLQGEGVERIKNSYFLKRIKSFLIDNDIIIEGYL